jgi:hypothetical protein
MFEKGSAKCRAFFVWAGLFLVEEIFGSPTGHSSRGLKPGPLYLSAVARLKPRPFKADAARDPAISGICGGLEADLGTFVVEALEGGFGAVDEGYDDLSLAGGAGALNKDVVAADDVLVAHGVAADFEGEDVAVADDVVQRNGLGRLGSFYRHAGGDAAGEDDAVAGAGAGAGRQHVNGAAAVVHAVEQALFLEVGDVLVHGGQALQLHAARDLFKRRGVAVAGHERFEEVENLFLPSSDSHGRIIANKKRTMSTIFSLVVREGGSVI